MKVSAAVRDRNVLMRMREQLLNITRHLAIQVRNTSRTLYCIFKIRNWQDSALVLEEEHGSVVNTYILA
jgi:hypothetical protein